MKREDLKALGLTDEQIDAVMKTHGQDITKLQADNDTLTKSQEQMKATIAERDEQLKTLNEAATGHQDLQAKITELTNLNAETTKKYQENLAKQKKDYLIDGYFKDKHAKNLTAVKAVFGERLDKIVVDGDKLVGMDDAYAEVYKGNEYLFDTVVPGKGGTPLGDIPGSKTEAEQMADLRKL